MISSSVRPYNYAVFFCVFSLIRVSSSMDDEARDAASGTNEPEPAAKMVPDSATNLAQAHDGEASTGEHISFDTPLLSHHVGSFLPAVLGSVPQTSSTSKISQQEAAAVERSPTQKTPASRPPTTDDAFAVIEAAVAKAMAPPERVPLYDQEDPLTSRTSFPMPDPADIPPTPAEASMERQSGSSIITPSKVHPAGFRFRFADFEQTEEIQNQKRTMETERRLPRMGRKEQGLACVNSERMKCPLSHPAVED